LIAVSGTRVYLESHDEDLFIVDRATGRIVASPEATFHRACLNLRDYDLGPTNSLDDRLYFGTRSGLIICLREIGQFAPRPLRDPKTPPFGYVPPEGIELKPAIQPPPVETPPVEAPPAEAPPAEAAPVAAPPE
jgi:hypothetical protein